MTPAATARKADDPRQGSWSAQFFPRFRFDPVSPADGGGYLAIHESIPGCHGVGSSPEDAYADWLDVAPEWCSFLYGWEGRA